MEIYGIEKAVQITQKQISSHVGQQSFRKGKTYKEIYGTAKAEMLQKELIKKQRERNPSRIAKLKEGWENNEERKKATRERRLKQVFPVKDTQIERKLQEQLTKANINFEKHKAITGQPDIYVPSMNICLFADGCYWHGCHECNIRGRGMNSQWHNDFRIKHELELEGYKVIRLWEHDINKPDFDIEKFLTLRAETEREADDRKETPATN